MGCDIHMYAERRKDKNSEWEQIKSPYRGRNYNLFAMLANVRNGRGFAGVKTGEGFNPICEPKGMPLDVCKEIAEENYCTVGEYTTIESMERWVENGHSEWVKFGETVTNPDHHSASYLTLQELLNYDWGQLTMLRGTITLKQYQELKENGGTPDSWCGSSWGMNVVTVGEDVADRFLTGEDIPELAGKDINVNYHWMVSYKDCAEDFYNDSIAELQSYGGEPDDIRIVFWFDN